jgi:hypothetical protein
MSFFARFYAVDRITLLFAFSVTSFRLEEDLEVRQWRLRHLI